MRAIYIGGTTSRKRSGSHWKIYLFLILFIAVVAGALKLTGPLIVEQWINQQGADSKGYAFSIRDVDLSIGKGQLGLKDVKVFNPQTNTEFLEAPNMTIQLNWQDFFFSQDLKVSLIADVIDLTLSKDLASALEKVKSEGDKTKDAIYLDALDGKISKVNIIEQKADESRTVLELNNVNLKVKEVTPVSINKKTEFSVSSNIADGGKLNLTGKTSEQGGSTPWSIEGSLKQVPADIFNKIAGDKLPFSFHSSNLDAEISAHSENGKVKGEISPAIDRLNLLQERPGIPAQSIKRLLTEDLTFTLPFTLKDQVTLQYEETYQKLKSYRRSPATSSNAAPAAETTTAPGPTKTTKKFSLWPF